MGSSNEFDDCLGASCGDTVEKRNSFPASVLQYFNNYDNQDLKDLSQDLIKVPISSLDSDDGRELLETLLELIIRMCVQREKTGLKDLDVHIIDDIVAIAVATNQKFDPFMGMAHMLCQDTSPLEYHKFADLMVLLNQKNIFNVKDVYYGDTAIHHTFRMSLTLLPCTIDVLAQHCSFNFNTTNDRESTVLHIASQIASRPTLERIVYHGANWNSKNIYGDKPLHSAAISGNSDALEYLLELQGVNANVTNNLGRTPLHMLCQSTRNFSKNLNILLKANANVNDVDNVGNNAAFFASCAENFAQKLELLVTHGCDWQQRNYKGQHILHLLAEHANVTDLKYFLSFGETHPQYKYNKQYIDVNVRDANEKTPLHYLVWGKTDFIEKLNLLLKHGAVINAINKCGNNILHCAIIAKKSKAELQHIVNCGGDWRAKRYLDRGVLHLAAEPGNEEAVAYFVALGADVNAVDSNGETPLHLTSLLKHIDKFRNMVEILAKHGANVNAVNVMGLNFVQLSILMGRTKEHLEYIVNVLGCDWKARNDIGQTVMHIAARSGNHQAVHYFASLGADVNARDYKEATPLEYLIFTEDNFIETLQALVQEGADVNASDVNGNTLFITATQCKRSVEELDAVLKLGGDRRVVGKNRQSALYHAAIAGNVDALKYILEKGAEVNLRDGDGFTPLLVCVKGESKRFLEIVKLLLEHGANLNATTKDGKNLLLLAARYGKSKLELETITNLGVDWKRNDNHGNSILHVLARVGNVEAIQYYVVLGADVNATNDLGETPLLQIGESNFFETASVLVENGATVYAVDRNGDNVIRHAMRSDRTCDELNHLVQLGADWMAMDEESPGLIRHIVERNAPINFGNIVSEEWRQP